MGFSTGDFVFDVKGGISSVEGVALTNFFDANSAVVLAVLRLVAPLRQ